MGTPSYTYRFRCIIYQAESYPTKTKLALKSRANTAFTVDPVIDHLSAMNLILLESQQFTSTTTATLSERQVKHIRQVLRSEAGDILTVGKLNGNLGKAQLNIDADQYSLSDIQCNQSPPAAMPITLILALPRPQMIKRILQTVSMFGIEKLVLIHSNRVEKSFWQSPSVSDNMIREQLILGLEQAKATQLPEVVKFMRFKPFIEDSCFNITEGSQRIVAHPGDFPASPSTAPNSPLSLAIGPEGGFTVYEMQLWQDAGFKPVQMGERIFKVETAVTALLARMM